MKILLQILAMLAIALTVFHTNVFADDSSAGWTWVVGCPESGVSGDSSGGSNVFSATTSGGFSGSGMCARTITRHTKFTFTSSSGGTLNSSTLPALHTGDVCIIPQTLSTEQKPIFTVAPECPVANKDLVWLFAQWDSNESHRLVGYNMLGTASYDTSTGLTVTNVYDVEGTLRYTGSIALAGSCSSGVYTLSGTGDRGGSLYLTKNGSGNLKALSGRATLFVPKYTISAATDLGSFTAPGLIFDSSSFSGSQAVRVQTNAAGTTWTVQPYSSIDTGAISGSFSDSIAITGVNSPANGMMVGTITRTGAGAGSAPIACIVSKGVATRVVCSFENTVTNTVPNTLAFTIEGPHVVGQPTGNSSLFNELLIAPRGMLKIGTKFLVVDSNQNRVLIWNSVPSGLTPADVVIGQPNNTSITSNSFGAVTGKTLYGPSAIWSDGTKLYISDLWNNRINIYDSIPTVNNTSANTILGHSSSTAYSSNDGGSISGRVFYAPMGMINVGTKFIAADRYNHRVLIWNAIPTSSSVSADAVLGQSTVTSNGGANAGGRSANSLNEPYSVASDGTKLIVCDSQNSRVLVWNTIPTTSNVSANVVIGQPDFTSGTANNGGAVAGNRLNYPTFVYVLSSKLYIADTNNNRVLIYNSIPTASNATANLVLGQTSMTSNGYFAGGISGASMGYPAAIYSDGAKFYVANSNRIQVWNATPTVTNQTADSIIGAAATSAGTVVPPAANNMDIPTDVFSDGTKFFVVDQNNNRVLIWNTIPTSNYVSADVVVGQPNMTSFSINAGGTVTGKTLSTPQGGYVTGGKLYIADGGNNRVLIFNTIPTANYTSADVVLGQPDTTSSTFNNGGGATPAANRMWTPYSITSSGTKLFVADYSNYRVLVWNTLPTATARSADFVLGQPDFTSRTNNNGGILPHTLSRPRGVYANGTKLFVADADNHRVLIWNTIPTTTFKSADVVLGQPDFTSGTENNGGIKANTFRYPHAIHSDGTKLFISDNWNNRVLIWNTIPTVNRTSANLQLGQTSMTGGATNAFGLSSKSLNNIRGIHVNAGRLYVADEANDRIVTFDVP